VEWYRKLWRDQPLLVGCGWALLLVLIVCGGGYKLVQMGWNKAGDLGSELSSKVSETSAGVDSIFQTAQDLAAAGFSFGASTTSGAGREYTLLPMPPREVRCEELKAVLQPHLVDDVSSVVIKSESTISNAAGVQQVIPVRCSWEGGAAAVPSQWDLPQTREPPDRP
jgi:hypothetical protein